MKIRLSQTTLRPDTELLSVIDDIVMVVLITINLIWIIFDWIFTNPLVQNVLQQHATGFFHFYNDNIHQHFLFYDLIFVSIFITEIIVRWIISIREQTYHRWYFYPFVHWYDVLGCIPIGSLRVLRLLRVISLVMKLQKRGVIDLTDTAAYRFIEKYLNVFAEEISDRVILRMLNSLEGEIQRNNPVAREIVTDVMAPRKEIIVEWLSSRIGTATQKSYLFHERDVREYVDKLITEAINKNKEIANLERLPMVGKFITTTLEKAISDIVFSVIQRMISDLAAPDRNEVVNELTNRLFEAVLEQPHDIDHVVRGMAMESIEVIKAHVRIQRWKEWV